MKDELKAVVDLIVRDVCELDPADPADPETLSVSVKDLGLILADRLAATPPAASAEAMEGVELSFQHRVHPWMLECFGEAIAADRTERADRFIEEALELAQAIGYDKARVAALVEYVWNRPVGEPAQEVGGVMVTLAALCNACGLHMEMAGEVELARILQPEIVLKIRAKQAAKARDIPFSPLPQPTHAPAPELSEAQFGQLCDVFGIGSGARSFSVLLANAQNATRRADCLSAVESEFFMVPGEPDEDYPDDEPADDCLLNWGESPEQYVETFRAALRRMEKPALSAFTREALDRMQAAVSEPDGSTVTLTKADACALGLALRRVAK